MTTFITVDSINESSHSLISQRHTQPRIELVLPQMPKHIASSMKPAAVLLPRQPVVIQAATPKPQQAQVLHPEVRVRPVRYKTAREVPRPMRGQIQALFEQHYPIQVLAKLFDTAEEAIEELTSGKTIQEQPKVTIKIIEPARREPELLPEKPKVKPKAMLSLESLKQRFIKNCKKSRKGEHWHYQNWNGNTPTFPIDGKPVSVRRAAYVLFNGPIAYGTEPVAKCGLFNCVAPECLVLIDERIAHSMKRPASWVIKEIRRLSMLGNSQEKIVEILGDKVPPRVVSRVQGDYAYRRVQ